MGRGPAYKHKYSLSNMPSASHRSPYTKHRPSKKRPPPTPPKSADAPSAPPDNKGLYKTTLVGHSFIRGFKLAMLQGHIDDHIQGGTHGAAFRDVVYGATAAEFARQIKIDLRYKKVYTHARLVTFIPDLTRDLTHILARNPDSIILNIGSNDLAALYNNFTEEQVIAMTDAIRDFVQFKIPNHIIVVCMGVVPRLSGINTTPDRFVDAADLFNRQLQILENKALAGEEPVNIRYNKMVGWNWIQVGNQHVRLDPRTWCNAQGIHPTDDMYKDKFCKSIRRALTMSKNRPIFVH